MKPPKRKLAVAVVAVGVLSAGAVAPSAEAMPPPNPCSYPNNFYCGSGENRGGSRAGVQARYVAARDTQFGPVDKVVRISMSTVQGTGDYVFVDLGYVSPQVNVACSVYTPGVTVGCDYWR